MTSIAEPGDEDVQDPRFLAAIELIGRTGANAFQIRYSDDESPIVWFAVAVYDEKRAETAAAFTPLRAVLRLTETLVDGGICVRCTRPSGLDPDSLDVMPADDLICWYQFDPELKKFRRGCEGADK